MQVPKSRCGNKFDYGNPEKPSVLLAEFARAMEFNTAEFAAVMVSDAQQGSSLGTPGLGAA
jgi:hypothetical protein